MLGGARRFSYGVLCALALAVVAAPSVEARGFDFRQCKRPGHEAFQCATMKVPLKLPAGRATSGSGSAGAAHRKRIRIHVERLKSSRGNRDEALLALAGGPGQAATDFASTFAQQLAPAYADKQLIVIDQRGTGRSGFLDCSALERADGNGTVAARRCSREVGPRARWYRTADSIADIEKLRKKLGVGELSLYGVSYGTNVAAQYARLYPHRTGSLILDSVFSGWDPLFRPTFEAAPRVLGAFCDDGACEGITDDLATDTARLVARARDGLEARVVTIGRGFPKQTTEIETPELLVTLMATDVNPALRAMWPGAVVAAVDGDPAPIARLIQIAGGDSGRAADRPDISNALNFATNCADTPNPWTTRLSIPLRRDATRELAVGTPAATFWPFDRRAAVGGAIANQCSGWSFGPQRGALTAEPLPDVPALLLEGEDDLRTPVETMERVRSELPHGESTIVSNQGHSVFGTAPACATRSLEAWIEGRSVPARCDQPRLTPNQPVPPRSLSEFTGDTVAERTFQAVEATVREDAIPMASVLLIAGRQIAGGVRSGAMVVERTAGGASRVTLRGYSLVRGVRLLGRIEIGERLEGRIRVKGFAAARGQVRIEDGAFSGELGGERFERQPTRETRRAAAAVTEAEPAPPTFP